jgi:hypothetical protein
MRKRCFFNKPNACIMYNQNIKLRFMPTLEEESENFPVSFMLQ